MKNTLVDLNNHLFEQLERLNDDELNGKELNTEIERSRAMATIASRIIENAHLGLEATKLKTQYRKDVELPVMLENK